MCGWCVVMCVVLYSGLLVVVCCVLFVVCWLLCVVW